MLSDGVVVRTADIAASALGGRMGEMRNWLDQRRIELTDFLPVSREAGKVAFEAHFREVGDAELFRAVFG